MTNRVIFRLSDADMANLDAVLTALRDRASSYQDRFPTRTKALRAALQVAAQVLSEPATAA